MTADPEAQYAAEQERLAQGGGADQTALPIPAMPEVRAEIYQETSLLIFRGFLTLSSEINDVGFVWKSLNQHEFDLIRLSGNFLPGRPLPERFWDTFIAYSLFMLDGVNILPERERWFERVRKMSRELPREAKQQVVRHLSELNRKASMLTILAEAYAMESYSRFRWAQVRGLDPASPSVTGVNGTERLGLNWAQLTWKAINHIEDMNADYERDWENAKFIGSCFAGKGLQKVYHQDHDRHRKEMEDKIARKDLLLRHVFEGVSLDDQGTTRDGNRVVVARTVEELAEQMSRDLRGEKDWHDQVVEAHMARQKAALAARERQMAEMARRNAEAFEGRGVQGSTSTEGLTPAQVQERMARRRQEDAQKLHQRQVPVLDERMTEHFQRWGMLPPAADPAAPPMPQREVGKPFRRP